MVTPAVVLGERLLARDVEHLLHHVHLVPDALHVGDDQPEPGPERARIAPEALDRVGVALRHYADAERDRDDDQDDERDDEDVEAERDWHGWPLATAALRGGDGEILAEQALTRPFARVEA